TPPAVRGSFRWRRDHLETGIGRRPSLGLRRTRVVAQNDVLADVEMLEDALRLAILREQEHAALEGLLRLLQLHRVASQPYHARFDLAQAVDRLAQLRPAGAENAGQPDDLSLIDTEADVSQQIARADGLELQAGSAPACPSRGRGARSAGLRDQRATAAQHGAE